MGRQSETRHGVARRQRGFRMKSGEKKEWRTANGEAGE
jgi:hypothetical protein